MKKIKITDLLIFVLTAELAGAVSGILSGGGFGAYYDTLVKPPFAPPGWLFPIVWGILYALMGVSAYLIYDSGDSRRKPALYLYFAQLFVNVLWSPVFFGLRSFSGAAIAVSVLLLLVAAMTVSFFKIRRCAALINIPYLLWSGFAAYLTFGFLLLNG